MAEIRDWFMQIPLITRAWFGASIALPLIGKLGIFNPYNMMLTTDFLGRLHVSLVSFLGSF